MASDHPRNLGPARASPQCEKIKKNNQRCGGRAKRGRRYCRSHGGNSGAPQGNQNAVTHGLYTRKSLELDRAARALLRRVNEVIREIDNFEELETDPRRLPGRLSGSNRNGGQTPRHGRHRFFAGSRKGEEAACLCRIGHGARGATTWIARAARPDPLVAPSDKYNKRWWGRLKKLEGRPQPPRGRPSDRALAEAMAKIEPVVPIQG